MQTMRNYEKQKWRLGNTIKITKVATTQPNDKIIEDIDLNKKALRSPNTRTQYI
jgi:hypothetical protein